MNKSLVATGGAFSSLIISATTAFAETPVPMKETGAGFLSESPFQPLIEKGLTLVPVVYETIIQILSISLIIAIIWMGASIITKNPQWMQWSKVTLVSTFITLLCIRLLPLLFLTSDVTRIKLIINKTIILLTQTGIHATIAMILIGLFIHFLYIMHENPAHYKWARSIMFGSVIVLILSLLLPKIVNVM